MKHIRNTQRNVFTGDDLKKLYKPTFKELFIPYSGFNYIDRIKEMEKNMFGDVTKEFHEKYTKRNLLGLIHGGEILILWAPLIYNLFKN